ncbi:RDD family protein [Thalassotalea fusca]
MKTQDADSKCLTAEETREVLTPFAFKIDESLFGIPLSKPWKRLIAILADLFLVLLLTETPGELLAIVIAIIFFRLGNRKRTETLGKNYGLRRRMMRFIGAFIIFILLISTLPRLFDKGAELINGEEGKSTSSITIEVEAPDKATENKREVASVIDDSMTKQEGGYLGIDWLKGVIHDLGLSFGWAAVYFTIFTALWEGQTPGKRLMGIRVLQLDGTPLSISDSFGRYGGYGAGLATGLLGFMQVLWDPNRQAIHDKISATIVVDAHIKINWKTK